MVVDTTGFDVLMLNDSQSSMLPKELDRKANEHTSYGQQDKRPYVNIK
jgi:hypothetical protein